MSCGGTAVVAGLSLRADASHSLIKAVVSLLVLLVGLLAAALLFFAAASTNTSTTTKANVVTPVTRLAVRRVRVDPLRPHPAARREPWRVEALVETMQRREQAVTFAAPTSGRQHEPRTFSRAFESLASTHEIRTLDETPTIEATSSSTGGSQTKETNPLESSSSSTAANDDGTASSSGVAVISSSTGAAASGVDLPSVPEVAGRVHLIDYSDYMYIGVIGVGTPAQSFGCVFDTGSADTWVFSSAFPVNSPDRQAWIHYFNASASSTYTHVLDATGKDGGWGIVYGKGRASGRVALETLTLASVPIPSVHMAFTTSVGDSTTFAHANEPIDGIFGLGFAQLATKPRMAVMPHAASNGGPAVFSFHMGSMSVDGSSGPQPDGDATHGATDMAQFSAQDALKHPGSWFQLGRDESLAPYGWTDLAILDPTLPGVDGRWIVDVGGLSIDGTSVSGLCTSGSSRCVAWVDTGTSFLLIPPSKWNSVMASIVAKRPDCEIHGACTGTVEARVTCSLLTYTLLPPITVVLGGGGSSGGSGTAFHLTPEEYLLRDADDKGVEFFQLGFGCAPASSGVDLWLLGDTFLKNYYTAFDMPRSVVSIANRGPSALSWLLVLSVALGTLASLLVCIVLVRWIHARRSRGVSIDVSLSPSSSVSQPSSLPSRSSARAPRGYAHVHRDAPSSEAEEEEHEPSAAASHYQQREQEEDLEMARLPPSRQSSEPQAKLLPPRTPQRDERVFDRSDLEEL